MSEIENAFQAEWFARAKFAATAARDRLSAAYPKSKVQNPREAVIWETVSRGASLTLGHPTWFNAIQSRAWAAGVSADYAGATSFSNMRRAAAGRRPAVGHPTRLPVPNGILTERH